MIILKNINGAPERLLTAVENQTVHSVLSNGKEFIYYQGNEVCEECNKKIEPPPDWLGLEQSLRYSELFAKAFTQASDKGFTLFTVTLLNGKKGDASENALTFAFQNLGVVWNDEEKAAINKILEQNFFTTRL